MSRLSQEHALLHDWLQAEDVHYQRMVRERQRRFEKFAREREGWIETGREMGERINQLEADLAAAHTRLERAEILMGAVYTRFWMRPNTSVEDRAVLAAADAFRSSGDGADDDPSTSR